jgi:dTDP-glucose 4,6-dehydratase
MNKQKVLLTGTGGMVLGNFVRKAIYEKHPYQFVSIDRVNKSSVLNNMYNNKNHQFYIGDIADDHFVNVVFEFERPDIVLHGAAETIDENRFIHSNILGTQVLVNASIKWGVKRFIYTSDDKVYGQLKNDLLPPWNETDPVNPSDEYAISKVTGEMLVKTSGLNYNIARSSNNYGPRQSPTKLIPKITKCVLDNKEIPIYDKGQQIRDWLHVFDNCAAILKILENGKSNEIYNVSANQEFSNLEVVNEICKILGKGHNLIKFVSDKPKHNFRYAMNTNKIKSLGWEPKFKFKTGLPYHIDWAIKNQNLY